MAALRIWVNVMEKKEIRNYIYKIREQQSEAEQHSKSVRICSEIIAAPAFAQADCIYAYMSCKGEVDTAMLRKACWDSNKKVAVPRVCGKELRFFYINSEADVEPGYYGIMEPRETLEEAHCEEALMIMPGVAFDELRGRCGYGGGFYDRYLSIHRDHQTISPAFEFQIITAVPRQEFDLSPQRIVTEKRWIL